MGESKTDPTISVVLPVYQAQRTLEEAVESVLAQSFDDFELIALDDGSTDASIRLLEAMAAHDDRILIHRHAHGGLVARLNDGIACARGVFIARMDADDICHPLRFEKQIRHLVAHPECVAVGTGAILIDPERRPIRRLDPVCEHDEIDARLLGGDARAFLHASVLYRADALRAAGGYTENREGGEDLDLHLRLAERGKLANLSEYLLEFRQGTDTLSARLMQVRRNQDAAIRAALGRRGLNLDSVSPRRSEKPNPDPDEVWANWANAALEAGYNETARRYARLSFEAARRRHWKLPLRTGLGSTFAWFDRFNRSGKPALVQSALLAQKRTDVGLAQDASDAPAAVVSDSVSDAPALTVLMSVHNGEAFLREAIDSILNQTFRDFEFLIIDDASTDSSPEIIASYDDVRIRRIVNPERLGLTRTLNRGIAFARGRYIARMDADDLSLPNRLQQQVAILDAEPDCALVATHAEKIDAFGMQVGLVAASTEPAVLRRRLIRQNCIIHGSVTIRRRMIDEVGCYDERMSCSQDYDLWLRMLEGHEIRVIPEPLYCWREHSHSISSVRAEEQQRCAELARDRARESRVLRVLQDLDGLRISLVQAADAITHLSREEEIGRLEHTVVSGAVWLLANWLQRTPSFGRWIWEPTRRRRAYAILSDHRASSRDREQTQSRLRAIIDPVA